MKLLIIIMTAFGLSACMSANIQKYETDIEQRQISHNSFAELSYSKLELGKDKYYKVQSPLPVLETSEGKGFALALEIPEGSNYIYFRSILSTASAKTAHIVYPTFVYLDSEKGEIKRVNPELTARNDMTFDAAYFDSTLEIERNSKYIVVLFSSENLGQKFRYQANLFVGGISSGTIIMSGYEVDRGIPVGPGGPFRIEFNAEK